MERSWLVEELRLIAGRPAMYLGDERLSSLACYMRGVFFGLALQKINDSKEERFLRLFGDWLSKKLDARNGDCWFYLSLIPETDGGVPVFFRELDLFITESGHAHGLFDERFHLQPFM